ncbi:hypothetical protein SDC9_147191 [bioreactor metagenome]|uniref:Uncharacterized protein n=1 Tax=bioreactor metagenome TaxID=1076179 RepID=A0A645EE15_9ZZZZ
MKRDRQAEGEKLLQRAEHNLRESLIEILPEVVASGENIFFNSRFNPHGLAPHLLSPQGEALFESASACLEVREALGLSSAGSVGELFLASCREAASDNPHRFGPRRLGADLMERLLHG